MTETRLRPPTDKQPEQKKPLARVLMEGHKRGFMDARRIVPQLQVRFDSVAYEQGYGAGYRLGVTTKDPYLANRGYWDAWYRGTVDSFATPPSQYNNPYALNDSQHLAYLTGWRVQQLRNPTP
jgi:hypothetical protein